jgi:hypothetical protein
VCEPEQALINWHRAHLRVLHGALLEDPRIRLLSEPLLEHLQRSRVPYDSILVNLDRRYQPASEAPSGRGNRPQLPWSLMQGSLRSGGRIVLWSETAQPQHERSLQRLGFTTTRHEIHPRPRGRGRRECVAVAALPYVSTAHGPRVQPPMFPGRRS